MHFSVATGGELALSGYVTFLFNSESVRLVKVTPPLIFHLLFMQTDVH